ncbi:hypothetical protein EXIGLDRAFT_833456 [Exidia glandulosa HHB12029]|uniref:DUF6534 domain-containing protein n=1 Tax=Exidia glandulosa HHB12029 TaxID=1314781 RepID=A0A165KNC1_EXIGL|nr:hypothetical protein EXIGLDRAFT_833456 [Exidia glandulosa HHB12029]
MDNSTTAFPPQIQFIVDNPDKTFGTWLCGGIADFILTGAVISMTAEYWVKYGKTDGHLYKGLVWTSLACNILKTIQTAAILWHKLVVGFGDYYAAAASPWYSTIVPLTSGEKDNTVAVFFALRLYRMMGGLRLLLIPLVATLAMGLAGNIALTVQAYQLSSIESLAMFNKTCIVALVGVMSADIVISASSSYYLWTSKTGFKRTDSLIARLLHLTWITALLPMISALLNLVTYVKLSPSGDSTFIAFNLISPKLYSVAMLYTLNTRQSLLSNESSYALNSRTDRHGAGVNVTVQRDTVQFTDGRAPGSAPTAVKFASHNNFDTSSDSPRKNGFGDSDTLSDKHVLGDEEV